MKHRPQERNQSDAENSPPNSITIAGIEKTFLRLTFWQTLLSVAGVFTGAVALYAALNESQAVRQQTAASVWPYVQFMINDTSTEESAFFTLSLNNVGVGPARMQSMQLSLHGTIIPSWQEMTDSLLKADSTVGKEYGKNNVSRRVLAPGESVIAFQTNDRALTLKMQEAVYSGAVKLAYCYCSIFDECWSVSISEPNSDQPVTPVDECRDYGTERFRD